MFGVMLGQQAVSRHGPRPVAVTGGGLLGAACGLLAFAPAADLMVSLLIAGMLIFGAGMVAAFVSGQVAALTGAAEAESGLAAGLVDTSFSMGSGFGIAITTSAMTAHIGTAAAPSLAVLTTAHRIGFGVAALFASLGVVAALALLRRPRTAPAAAAVPPAEPVEDGSRPRRLSPRTPTGC